MQGRAVASGSAAALLRLRLVLAPGLRFPPGLRFAPGLRLAPRLRLLLLLSLSLLLEVPLLLGTALLLGLSLVLPPAEASTHSLPLVRLAAPPGSAGPLVLLLSGDGDWAAFPRGLAEAAARAGSPVLGLKTRAYLSRGSRTPAEVAADLEGPVRAELAASQRRDLVIVGYSRGADWAAFIVNRWPEDLRARVRAVAFVGLSDHASFEFHFEDLFRDERRATDVPTRPEVERLEGLPMICVYGTDEVDTLCAHPVPGMKLVEHAGSHRVKDDRELIAELLGDLGIGAKTAGSVR